MIKKVVLSLILVSSVNAADICDKYYKMYNIDPYIKSRAGWERSIKNKTIYNYFISYPSIDEVTKVQECLLVDSVEMKNYNRSIGVKR